MLVSGTLLPSTIISLLLFQALVDFDCLNNMLIASDCAIFENCFQSMEIVFVLEMFQNMTSRNSLGCKFSFAAVEKNRIHVTWKSDKFLDRERSKFFLELSQDFGIFSRIQCMVRRIIGCIVGIQIER